MQTPLMVLAAWLADMSPVIVSLAFTLGGWRWAKYIKAHAHDRD